MMILKCGESLFRVRGTPLHTAPRSSLTTPIICRALRHTVNHTTASVVGAQIQQLLTAENATSVACLQALLKHLSKCYDSESLWITDALLADTFYNFCHSSRRYGSNVPGPLEARKRASKRKNTSLAHVGGGQYAHDPAVTFGLGSGSRSKEQWWKRVETKPPMWANHSGNPLHGHEMDTGSSSSLPTWLYELTQPPHIQRNIAHGQSRPDESELEDGDASSATNLEQQLQRCIASNTITLASVLGVIEDMHLDLRHHPQLSEIAFGRLVEVYQLTQDYKNLALALHEPALHPPGSNNQLAFLLGLCSNGIARKHWQRHVFPAILKSIELGLVSTHDIQQITLLIPKIHKATSLSDRTGIDLTGCKTWSDWINHETHSDWHSILASIEMCRVLHLQDLDTTFLSSWYQRAMKSAHTDGTCRLLWTLRACSDVSELALASELITRRLHNLVRTGQEASDKMLDWFLDLPAPLQGSVIINTTFRLVAAAQRYDASGKEVIDKWSRMLSNLSTKRLDESLITKSAWSEVSSLPCELNQSEQLLTVVWLLTKLYPEASDTENRSATLDLQGDFEKVFAAAEDAGRFDHITQMVLTIDDLPLPDKNQIFSFLQHSTEDDLIKMLTTEQHRERIKSCLSTDYASLQDDGFYLPARREYPELLRTLTESVNKDLDQFKAMAQILVLKSNQNFRIVRRLLDHNMELRFAAAQAWPTRMRSHRRRNSQLQLNPFVVLELLESLTLTFAVTPVVSPRSAFRQVYKMYLFFHKIGAPIDPIIARALWHSGVTRYGQTGAAKTQVAWCYSKVKQIEGPEVANRLVLSAGFRRGLLRDFERTLKQSFACLDLPDDLQGVQAWDSASTTTTDEADSVDDDFDRLAMA